MLHVRCPVQRWSPSRFVCCSMLAKTAYLVMFQRLVLTVCRFWNGGNSTLTECMEQRRAWEANSRSAGHIMLPSQRQPIPFQKIKFVTVFERFPYVACYQSVGAFTKLRKATVNFVVPVLSSVRLSTRNISAPTGMISVKLANWGFFENLFRKINCG